MIKKLNTHEANAVKREQKKDLAALDKEKATLKQQQAQNTSRAKQARVAAAKRHAAESNLSVQIKQLKHKNASVSTKIKTL